MASVLTLDTIPAVFYRGGTSNALMIRKSHLPATQSEWEPILAGALGSPDPYKRQLNGMGGGVSSLSKVCVISPSKTLGADVDYTFVQMGITDGKMDVAGTCGNMTAAVGPFAVDEGIVVPIIQDHGGQQKATVRVYNTNTNKIIHCEFSVRGSVPRFESVGDYAIDGVPGFGSRISLSFISPGGAKTGRTLPTANAVDIMNLKIGANSTLLSLEVSLVDVGNPAVIIKSDDIGVSGTIPPTELDTDQDKMELLELIRREGARMMGVDPMVDSIPKMVLVSTPPPSSEKVNLVARVLSMRQVHKAIPLTIALNLGVACHISGTLPHTLMKGPICDGRIVIGHPSGKIEVGARMQDGDVESAILHRTARPLMKGEVYWR